jgi:hypothetical protein
MKLKKQFGISSDVHSESSELNKLKIEVLSKVGDRIKEK